MILFVEEVYVSSFVLMYRFNPLSWRIKILHVGDGLKLSKDISIPQNLTSSELSSLEIFPSQAQTENQRVVYVPVTVSLLAVVVLRCVLGLWTSSQRFRSHKISSCQRKTIILSWRHIRETKDIRWKGIARTGHFDGICRNEVSVR